MTSYNNALDNNVVYEKALEDGQDETVANAMDRIMERVRTGKMVAGAVVLVERDGGKDGVTVSYLGDRGAFAQVVFGCLLGTRMVLSNDQVFIMHEGNLERAKF